VAASGPAISKYVMVFGILPIRRRAAPGLTGAETLVS
jgi:hypothetical protein